MKRLFVGAIATFFATFPSIASAEQITIEKIRKQVITSSLFALINSVSEVEDPYQMFELQDKYLEVANSVSDIYKLEYQLNKLNK